MKLDIGCGAKPTGDINIDRYTIERGTSSKGKSLIDIQADASFLPFRDRQFDEVYSSHCIEHSDSPALFLDEAERVCRNTITILCPTRWQNKDPYHKWTLTRTWFRKKGYSTSISKTA